jgi:hypothetical protein
MFGLLALEARGRPTASFACAHACREIALCVSSFDPNEVRVIAPTDTHPYDRRACGLIISAALDEFITEFPSSHVRTFIAAEYPSQLGCG